MKKKLLFMLALLTFAAGTVNAQSGSWSDVANRDTSWGSDYGTATEFIITTPGQFAQFAYQVNSGYDYFADLLDDTSFDRDMVLPCLLKPEERYLVNTYDGTLVNEINSNFVMNPSCPLLLYYVHDDPWTIGKPEKVGPMTKMIINPIGKHNSDINDPALCPPEIKQELVDYVQKYLF